MIFIVKSDPNNLSVAGEITVPSFTFSPAANGRPTFRGRPGERRYCRRRSMCPWWAAVAAAAARLRPARLGQRSGDHQDLELQTHGSLLAGTAWRDAQD
jgi:hypothetical protein